MIHRFGSAVAEWRTNANLFSLSGISTTTDGLFDTAPSDKDNGAVNATLRINVGGVAYWIPLWDTKDGS